MATGILRRGEATCRHDFAIWAGTLCFSGGDVDSAFRGDSDDDPSDQTSKADALPYSLEEIRIFASGLVATTTSNGLLKKHEPAAALADARAARDRERDFYHQRIERHHRCSTLWKMAILIQIRKEEG